jgi:uncharacterized small protein (DUF1192 family)
MFDDEPKPKPKPHEIGQDLTSLSIMELTERVALLKEEILRLEQAKAAKGSVRQAANAIFQSQIKATDG